MTKARTWAEEIKAWADGKVIQWEAYAGRWIDFDDLEHQGPWGDNTCKWRIKPEPKKGWVRVAEHGESGCRWVVKLSEHGGKSEAEIEARPHFIRWLSPRLDFDYPEDYERVEMCRESETALRAAIAKATGAQS